MSKIKRFEQIPKTRFKRWYSSKQLLDLTGHLIIIVDLWDKFGNYSRQIGESTNSNLKQRFDLILNDAFLNAKYKHKAQHGILKVQTDEEIFIKVKLIDFKIRYYTDFSEDERKSPFTIKTFNMRNKRYTDIRFKGKLINRSRVKYISKSYVGEKLRKETLD